MALSVADVGDDNSGGGSGTAMVFGSFPRLTDGGSCASHSGGEIGHGDVSGDVSGDIEQ